MPNTPSAIAGPDAPRRARRPLVLTGECGGVTAAAIRRAGWGRLKVARRYRPEAGEPWGLDNGAWRYFARGLAPDWTVFERQVDDVCAIVLHEGHHWPMFAVAPDLVAQGAASLALSAEWMARWHGAWRAHTDAPPAPATAPAQDARYRFLAIPAWYLAVQDGMDPAATLDRGHPAFYAGGVPMGLAFAGVFLGGTAPWKEATARAWRAAADRWGMRLHYARASSARKLRHAFDVGADSVDSTQPLWTIAGREAYARAHARLDAPQLPLL